ncbi:MAG: 2-amino-4-hydroxy-6-hydroxymethyldihydropteridine diphosphokinase, partial [Opitutaceae bacterium]|nr:2-amino-4-hydroxy-6-hydroxymethyldihydropteridine diphosphokinase [Opitutaceae bacterium]
PPPPAGAPAAAYLSLGSNLGDRRRALAFARGQLAATPGVTLDAASPVYETAPHGTPGPQPDYLNQVVRVITTLAPGVLLHRCLEIENRHGRVRPSRHAPRTLDIDLLLHGDAVCDTPFLTLPHPRMRERAFVLVPLADIAPGLSVNGIPVARLLRGLDVETVRPAPAEGG